MFYKFSMVSNISEIKAFMIDFFTREVKIESIQFKNLSKCTSICVASFDDDKECKLESITLFDISHHWHVESFMVINRSHNTKRTERNKKCRTRLSEHIRKTLYFLSINITDTWQDDRLGIVVHASQIRLKTNPDDSYAWQRKEEKEHLFIKYLSDLSIRQLKELWEGIDKSFVAVRRPLIQTQPKAEFGEEMVWNKFLYETIFHWHLEIRFSISQKMKPVSLSK